MKSSFTMLFCGVSLALATESDASCSDGTCPQDESTLLQLQGLRAHRFGTAVPNEGTQCWHGNQCNKQAGLCPSYCGTGVCCRNSWTAQNDAEEEYCGANGYGNNGMHQCHPNPVEYRDVSQLPHTWQSAERSFGVEVPLDPARAVKSVTVLSDWWMKRPGLVAVYATAQDGATHKLGEFEYGGSLDICSGGSGGCAHPDDGTGSATSQRTVRFNSDIVATSVRVQVVTPRNANGQPNGQVIMKGVQVNTGANFGEAGGGNTCVGGDVSEADCLAAAQGLLASGQTQGRTNLVAGSWGWVPPGCSVQTHFTHGVDGDFAAHYNNDENGANDGGYTKVCHTDCQHLPNQDVVAGTFAHYGKDYGNSPSDEECSQTCSADPECTAWVRQPSTGSCWISRQAVVTFEADTDRTTGLRCNQ